MGVTAVVAAQLAFTYLPWFNSAFGTDPISFQEAGVVVALGAMLLLVTEVEKYIRRRLILRLGAA